MDPEPKMSDTEIEGGLDLQQTRSGWSIAESLSPVRETVFIFVICMAQFMTQAGLGSQLAPLTIIGNSFHITDNGILSWFVAGYSLTVGTFILFFGRCGDCFGYHTMFVIGFVWFGIWSMVAGVSVYSNSVLFIFARTAQGLGPAMLLPNGLAILGATYRPGPKKDMIFAIFGATAPNGAIIGAVFAALFSQLAWWPWTFWATAIVCLVLAALGWAVIPRIHHEREKHGMTLVEWMQELDIVGACLGVGGADSRERGVEPGAHRRLADGVCVRAADYRAGSARVFLRVGAARRAQTAHPAPGVDAGRVLRAGLCRMRLGQLRHLDVLPLAVPGACPRRDPVDGRGAVCAAGGLGLARVVHDRVFNESDPAGVDHVICHGGVHAGEYLCCDCAGASDLLGADFCFVGGHAVGHGHVFPREHSAAVERGGAPASGDCGFLGHDGGQL